MASASLEVAAPARVADVERAVAQMGLNVDAVIEESPVYDGYPVAVIMYGEHATLDDLLPRVQTALKDALGVDVATGSQLEAALARR